MSAVVDPLYLPGFDPAAHQVDNAHDFGGQDAVVGDTMIASPHDRTFAGLPIPTLVLAAMMLVLALVSAWQVREILALRSHRIVSVSLATLVNNYIATEAHNGGTPEIVAMRTKLYLAATQAAIRTLTDQGTTVLVSEAVAGNSVPDVTPAVKADIEAKLRAAQIAIAAGGK